MSTLFPTPIQIKRTSGGSYVRGVWQAGTEQQITTLGSCQPVTGKAIDSLPTNRRDIGQIKVYTDDRLLVATEGGDTTGDIVVWDGKLWEVWDSQPNSNNLIPHFKSLAQYKGEAQ